MCVQDNYCGKMTGNPGSYGVGENEFNRLWTVPRMVIWIHASHPPTLKLNAVGPAIWYAINQYFYFSILTGSSFSALNIKYPHLINEMIKSNNYFVNKINIMCIYAKRDYLEHVKE